MQSNREEDVRGGLERRLRAEGLDTLMPRVMVPTESVAEVRSGKKRVVQRKLYPGYVMAEVQADDHGRVPDNLWFLVRETPGVGDFIGGNTPSPMSREEVNRLLGRTEKPEETPKLRVEFKEGDTVKIKEGPFESFKGTVEEVNPATGRVKVILEIFRRATQVELEYWQIEPG